MPATTDDKPTPLRVGVLIHAPIQLLDLSPIDLFGMLTKDYLQACRLPSPLVNLGIPVEIHYISSTPFPTSAPQPENPSVATSPTLAGMTASAALRLTASIDDGVVAPGKLDIILIPGPDPSLTIPDATGEWLRAHYEQAGATLMSVCTGIFVLASSRVLEGKSATGPRGLMGELRGSWPGVRWVEGRWVKDGNGNREVWSSGM
jgi:putative intracellular protease/amidase